VKTALVTTDAHKHCRGCRYILDFLVEPRCPECGQPFDPNDPRTFRTDERRRWKTAYLALGFLLLVPMVMVEVTRPHRDYPILDISGVELNGSHVVHCLLAAATTCAALGFERSPRAGWVLITLLLAVALYEIMRPALS
jgi:hypothetical protein